MFVPQTTFPGPVTSTVPATLVTLYELSADRPDLSWVSPARPDLSRASGAATPVSFDVSGLEPWAAGDRIVIQSSQAGFREDMSFGALSSLPTSGATSWAGTFDWFNASSSLDPPGLPDAAKGDTLYVSQRATRAVAADGASWGSVAAFARLTGITLADGIAGTMAAALSPPPVTSTLDADVRGTRWGALAGAIHPGATVSGESGFSGYGLLATPRSTSFPDMPYSTLASVGGLSFGDLTADHDYGSLAYGSFLDSGWNEWVSAVFGYVSPDVDPLWTRGPFPVAEAIAQVPKSTLVGPLLPQIGPPTAPQVAGKDAFAQQAGVGLAPTLSWSPPAFGIPTSYRVLVVQVTPLAAPNDVTAIAAIVHGTSFQVPAGFMKTGQFYIASIAAVSAAGDALDAPPFRRGLPYHSADCVTAAFEP